MADTPTNLALKGATVKGATLKKGELTIVITAPAEDANVTLGELNDLTAGGWKGTITFKGRAQQLSLIPDKPPKEN